jgi:hypothetical protein
LVKTGASFRQTNTKEVEVTPQESINSGKEDGNKSSCEAVWAFQGVLRIIRSVSKARDEQAWDKGLLEYINFIYCSKYVYKTQRNSSRLGMKGNNVLCGM